MIKHYFSKIKPFAEGLALLVFVLFGLFGALVLGAVLHEYSHASDFKSIAEDEKLCGLVLPNKISSLFSGEIGYYLFSLRDEGINYKEFKQIEKYTEYKAYGISIVVLLVFVACFEIVFHNLWSETKKIKEIFALKNKEQAKLHESNTLHHQKTASVINSYNSLSLRH